MIHREDIGRPIAIMRADQVRIGDRIVHPDPFQQFDPHQVERVVDIEHIGDDVVIHHRINRTGTVGNFTTSEGNAVIIVR